MFEFNLEELRMEEYLSEMIASAEASELQNFRTDHGLEAVENIYSDSKEQYSDPENFSQKMLYRHLEEETGIVRETESGDFYIAWDEEDIELFYDRLEQHLSRGFDRPELVAYMRVEYEKLGESPSQSHFRDNDDLPSEVPYKSRYGNWNNALFMAGLEPNETDSGKDVLEEELIIKTHEMNEDSDILLRTPSAREINEDDSMHSESQFQHHFGSIEEAFESASLGTIRVLEASDDERAFSRRYRSRSRP